MASVTKQEMVEAFKNDATPGVQASISAQTLYKKENEVTINWNSSVQKKRAILKRLYPEEDFTSTAKTILSKMTG
jgi:hemin uptake protein HemP